VAAYILKDLGVDSIRLMTNNPLKIQRLEELGVHVSERVPLQSTIYEDNAQYLFTKALRMNHLLDLEAFSVGEINHQHGSY
jgi:3,4-dihydroxy 2-butanone 4-phosphate synthase/GTP cyclohydrolase II